MKRLTTDDAQSILYGLNLIFVKDGEIWIRGGGPAPDYPDCTLVEYIGRIAETHHLDIVSRDAESLGDEMYDCLQYGVEELEGVVAFLHAAAVQAAEMRGRLSDIEDILGGDYDLDRLRELVKADQEGRCVVLPCKLHDKVFFIENGCVKETEVDAFHNWTSGLWKISTHTDRMFDHWKGYEIDFAGIGKTVFLTREAAEDALKGEQHEKH